MTVGSELNRNDYTGNGAVDTYSYGFKVFDEEHLLVTVRDPDTGVETTLALTTDYTVTGVGSSAGGSIVLVDNGQDWIDADGDLVTDWHLTIRRVLPLTQETDIANQGTFLPEVHEDQFDREVMISQQQQDEIDRSVKLPETVAAAGFDSTLPADIASYPGAYVGVNANGDGLVIIEASSPTFELSTAAVYCGTSSGTNDITLSTPVATLQNGMVIIWNVGVTNTGPMTVAVHGNTGKSLKDRAGNDLDPGDLQAGDYVMAVFRGSEFQMLSMGPQRIGVRSANGNGSAVRFSYPRPNGFAYYQPKSKAYVRIVVDGVEVLQKDFSLDNATSEVVLASAPPSGTNNVDIYVHF